MNYEENEKRLVYNIDFDGTLTTGESYINLVPSHPMIDRVRECYFQGHIIIIWSARLWEDASMIVSWLIKNNVPYHGIMLGKGGSDHYVDDKTVHISKFQSMYDGVEK